ncbi:diguanylate cyclase (GGDEF)-like protein/PAS domain S-box-containing protein [Neorhizobium galegae]|nr:diguanylate cyclase (GGDEF)-like protein/PAS domain S-box-containing protein [Neorhizobium galegae]
MPASVADIVGRMPFPTVLIDRVSSRLLHANGAFEAAWQRPSVAADALTLSALLDPRDRPALELMLAQAGLPQAVVPSSVELRLPMADGAIKWALATCARPETETADGSLILLQLCDITRQKRAEEEIAARETRWNSALVSSVSGVWDHNYGIGQKYYSPTWRLIRGMAPDDPLPPSKEAWLTLLHPDDVDFTLHAMERQEAGDPEYQMFQYRERHADGHWIWIECRGACIERAPDGRALRVVGTDTDVTDRKHAEHGRAQMSRRLEMALAISGIGVYEADLVTGDVYWDERMYDIYGLDPAMPVAVGQTWENFLHPSDRERVLNNVAVNTQQNERYWDQYRIITASGGERVIRSCSMTFVDTDGHLKMVGANWDISKDVTLHQELERARLLAEARNRELESARVNIEHNAMHDYLTGLPNRRYLDAVLVEQARTCGREGRSLAVLHIDLDGFKQINDTLGHNAGDSILRHAALVLRDNAGPDQFVARIGGDEFVILTPATGGTRKLSSLANRIIRQMRKPVVHEGRECRFGASIGIAWTQGMAVEPKQLLINADMALYRAKNAGRNRHEFYSQETHLEIVRAKRTADDILAAIEEGQFQAAYQLQFDAVTLEVCGAETLARWQHPRHGLLTPDSFLSIAEDIDVVAAIDGIILDQALQDFVKWEAQGVPVPKISANVSYRRLLDPALLRKLRRKNIPTGSLSFELLESAFLDDCGDDVLQTLEQLKSLGIEIEIDDFGSGHASIVSLLRLNPAALKIDRQLVRQLPQSASQRKLARSIVEIGKSLNIKVVAEGVETMDHARILQELGCDVLQGFALARPMPFEEIGPFIRAGSWHAICC